MSEITPGCVKVVLIGDGASGKTSLLTSYTESHFPREYVPTVYDTYSCPIRVDGKDVTLELWDTAGQEGYDRLRPLAYTHTDVFVICFDLTDIESLNNVTKKWVPELRSHAKDVPIMLAGTKMDLQNEHYEMHGERIQRKSVLDIALSNGIVKYIECSALTQKNLQYLFVNAAKVGLKLSHKK